MTTSQEVGIRGQDGRAKPEVAHATDGLFAISSEMIPVQPAVTVLSPRNMAG